MPNRFNAVLQAIDEPTEIDGTLFVPESEDSVAFAMGPATAPIATLRAAPGEEVGIDAGHAFSLERPPEVEDRSQLGAYYYEQGLIDQSINFEPAGYESAHLHCPHCGQWLTHYRCDTEWCTRHNLPLAGPSYEAATEWEEIQEHQRIFGGGAPVATDTSIAVPRQSMGRDSNVSPSPQTIWEGTIGMAGRVYSQPATRGSRSFSGGFGI